MPELLGETRDTTEGPRRPGGQIASRPLHFIWLIDGSGSMQAQGKMEALNAAVRGTIPALQRLGRDHPQATIYVNAIRFGDGARWLAERLIPVSEFEWEDMEAGGLTALGEALTMVGETLQAPLIPGRALPPILVLVTDGLPTDDFRAGLDHLLGKAWGRRALRLAVTLGRDGAAPEAQEILRAFLSDDAPPVLQANHSEMLAGQLHWIATAALRAICAPEMGRLDSAREILSPPEELRSTPDEADIW
jgi:uncharacterized protein YegL